MEGPGRKNSLPEGLGYKLMIAGAIVLTCVFILVIRYFLKPQEAPSDPAAVRSNVFDADPGPVAGSIPAPAPADTQGSSLEMLKDANQNAFVKRAAAPAEKAAPAPAAPAKRKAGSGL